MRTYRYFLAVLLIVVLLVLAFVFLTRPKNTTSVKTVKLSDYATTDSEVSYSQEGQTNADSLHRTIKITVNNHLTNITIFSGYQGNVLKSETISNNENAYRAFLAGLQTQGFISQRKIASNVTMLGSCALGNKFIFTTSGIPNAPTELWTTSCPGSKGTFSGRLGNVQQLFRLQVPNYSAFTSGTGL